MRHLRVGWLVGSRARFLGCEGSDGFRGSWKVWGVRDLKGWSIATFWQHWKLPEDRQVPRYTKASYGFVWFSKSRGGRSAPKFVSQWMKEASC